MLESGIVSMGAANAPVKMQIGALLTGCSAKNLPNLRNLAMELRKVCCHPVRPILAAC